MKRNIKLVPPSLSQDLKDFCKIAEMMYNKEHFTFQGLNQIRIIKAGMNKKSTLFSNSDSVFKR